MGIHYTFEFGAKIPCKMNVFALITKLERERQDRIHDFAVITKLAIERQDRILGMPKAIPFNTFFHLNGQPWV